ncbi:ATP-binding protein (plasmid) [Embleya sp. NBC_00888]|uniref:sensor histidine kinase n=1 Tax=Embleya sp. NBC_00888 TaxID=2975960 RepID=UPI002F918286|nr:ATP-binding protein [Embleya sp. NBC_00888]
MCVGTGCAATAAAEALGVSHLAGVVLGCAVSATTVGGPLGVATARVRRYWHGRWEWAGARAVEAEKSARRAEHALNHLTGSTRHLAEARLRVLLEDPQARRGDVPSAPVDPCPAEPWASAVRADHEALVDAVFVALEVERGKRENTQYAFLAMAERVRAQAQLAIAEARELRGRVTDSSLLAALMRDEHAWARVGRAAQALEVLSGGRPGRSWDRPLLLSEVVGAAQSRILDYLRVSVVGGEDTAVHGVHAEALIHALAELVDNSTWFSPPTSTVRVQVERGHDGASVVIEDAGRGMDAQTMQRAQEAVNRADADVSTLGGDPRFGLAVVGVLAGRIGFRVQFSAPGAHGGIRTVVWIPGHLLTPPPPQPVRPGTRATSAGASARAGTPAIPATPKAQAPAAASAVLPQRPRRRVEPQGVAGGRRDAATAVGPRTPIDAGAPSGPGSPPEGTPDSAPPGHDAFISAFVNGRPTAPDTGTTADAVPDFTADHFRSQDEGPTP